jgi:hypothetical protein
MTRVTVTIDRLKLTGFEPADRHALVEGLRRELARLLADPQARSAWASAPDRAVLRLGQMQFEPGPTGGRKLGAGVARAVGKGLTR